MEAKNSISFSITDSNGLDLIFTHREEDDDKAITAVKKISDQLIALGCKPQAPKFGRRGGFPEKKPIEYIQGRVCPVCRAPLIYFEAKGKKHIKCSTAKWNSQTRTNMGCTFIEWTQDPQPTSIEDFPNN
mgnify:CR=1 FL=1